MSDRSHFALGASARSAQTTAAGLRSHATMRSACGTNWNFTASVSPRYSPSAWSAIGRAERSVRDSEPSTDSRSRPARRAAPDVQHLADRVEDRGQPEPLQRQQVEPGVEIWIRNGQQRAVAEVGPRRAVGDDGHEQAADRRLAVALHGQGRPAPVGAAVVLVHHRPQEQRHALPAALARAAGPPPAPPRRPSPGPR